MAGFRTKVKDYSATLSKGCSGNWILNMILQTDDGYGKKPLILKVSHFNIERIKYMTEAKITLSDISIPFFITKPPCIDR